MKKYIKHIFLTLALLLFISSGYAQTLFQIVESVPVETKLEQSKLPRAFDVWLDMIRSAKKSIDIEIFYIADEKGEPLEQIIEEIIKAGERGVNVRIIIDENFYKRYPDSDKPFRDKKNIALRIIPFSGLKGGVMHAKYFVVDSGDLFLGSQNFDYRALKHIHELGVRVKHKGLAAMFVKLFETDWALCIEKNPSQEEIDKLLSSAPKRVYTYKNKLSIKTKNYGSIKLYPAFSPTGFINKGYADEEEELVRFIRKAKKTLYINYFSYSTKGKSKDAPYTVIDDEIRRAAERGVEVKIIFSDWAIKKEAIEQIKELSKVPGVTVKLSTIPQYSGGFIPYSRVQHCKIMIKDGTHSWVSTANFERSYFHESRNATIIIENKKVFGELLNVFNRVWESGYAELVDVNKDYKSVKRE